ncbi:MAG: four helix bundle protein [Candidatus Hydrogenedentes bacterium]|nr:four helix bundle protein [Candidatus Hydrogenedentota bacterium]
MATIEKFEDVEAWQKARELTRAVYKTTSGSAFARDFSLRDQIRRASVSVMSNIAEGFDRRGNREFVQFLSIAKGSVAEVQAQLYVALDAGYLQQEAFDYLYGLARDTGRLIGGFIRYLTNATQQATKPRK